MKLQVLTEIRHSLRRLAEMTVPPVDGFLDVRARIAALVDGHLLHEELPRTRFTVDESRCGGKLDTTISDTVKQDAAGALAEIDQAQARQANVFQELTAKLKRGN